MSGRSDHTSGDEKKTKVPKWVPIALLTVTSIALTAPALLLWKQKRSLGVQTSSLITQRGDQSASTPLRRRVRVNSRVPAETSVNSSLKSETTNTCSSTPRLRVTTPNGKVVVSSSRNGKSTEDGASLSDGPLLSIGALGIATGVVGVVAMVGIWGIQRSLGVHNVDEFATEVRWILLSRFPALSQSIYRAPCESDGTLPSKELSVSSSKSDSTEQIKGDWSWDAAEERLSSAFESGGVSEWAECALKELEEESKLERSKRGL